MIMIIGACTGMVAPKLIGAYDGIKAAAEEQKLTDIIESIKMRSFLRQTEYAIELKNNVLNLKDKEVRLEFNFISFPDATIMFNGNGFPDSRTLKYFLRGKKKGLNIFQG